MNSDINELITGKLSTSKIRELVEPLLAAITWKLVFLWLSVSHHYGGIFINSSSQRCFSFMSIYSFMHSSVKVPAQHFSRFELWTLTGPSQHLHPVVLISFVVDLHHYPTVAELQLSDKRLCTSSTILWYTEEFTINWITAQNKILDRDLHFYCSWNKKLTVHKLWVVYN